jgi:hypothetical protein
MKSPFRCDAEFTPKIQLCVCSLSPEAHGHQSGAETEDPFPHGLHSMSLIHSLDGPGSEGVAACDGHKKIPPL